MIISDGSMIMIRHRAEFTDRLDCDLIGAAGHSGGGGAAPLTAAVRAGHAAAGGRVAAGHRWLVGRGG